MMNTTKLSKSLIHWYHKNSRPLPWRESRDPYKIWISEVMLQQTTATAVIPYYQAFINRFPTLNSLSEAPLKSVLKMWAGLGYYSRARNLHRAAQLLSQRPAFPRSHKELILLPGFGPYTSRAVSSFAFSESVGVLDGNVIRVLTRLYGLKIKWWKTKERTQLQELADQLAQDTNSYYLNQGLMELGATICTPQRPHCYLCPWLKSCKAHAQNLEHKLPLKKPRRKTEIWLWQMKLIKKSNRYLLTPNTHMPFLKKHLLPPGEALQLSKKPTDYNFRHSITHHDIYVQIKKSSSQSKMVGKWLSQNQISEISPFSILRKAFQYADL